MLYLRPLADDSHGHLPRLVPLVEQTAHRLERALLASDKHQTRQQVAEAAAEDREFTRWLLRAAEMRLGRTVNRLEQAIDWLTNSLDGELAAALTSGEPLSEPNDIQWRLPALAKTLASYRRESGEFHRRLETEKLEAMKELAYGASHEINNPLANIAARAQTLLDDEESAERRHKLRAIHRQAMRAHEMIADLMLFARPPKLKRQPQPLDGLVRAVVEELAEWARESDIVLECDTDDGPIEGLVDATQLGVAVRALVVNALEAVGGGGRVGVALRRATFDGQPAAMIVVQDDGPGVSDDVRPHLFDPFFSGREAGRGLGFGLSKCWRIVTDHGGRVEVMCYGGGGAEFCILLPAADGHSRVAV